MVTFLHSRGSFLLTANSPAILDKIIKYMVVVAASKLKDRLLSVLWDKKTGKYFCTAFPRVSSSGNVAYTFLFKKKKKKDLIMLLSPLSPKKEKDLEISLCTCSDLHINTDPKP